MREEKLGFGIIFRIGLSLLPILFGMSLPAMVWCSFNITMSYIVFGPLTSLVSSLVTVCISMFFCGFCYGPEGNIEGLFLAMQAILCAAACIYAVSKRKEFFTGVWLAAIGFLIPSFLSLKNAAEKVGMSIVQYLTDVPIESLKEQFATNLNNSGIDMNAVQVNNLFDELHSLIAGIVPSIIIISSIVVGYIIMWCVCAKLRTVPNGIYHSFSMIKIPRTMVAVIAVAIAVLLFNFGKTVNFVTLNFLFILLYLCFFAGISVIDYFLRLSIPGKFIRVLVHCVILMFASGIIMLGPYVNIFTIYILLAVVDSFFDFRKIRKRRVSGETEKREA